MPDFVRLAYAIFNPNAVESISYGDKFGWINFTSGASLMMDRTHVKKFEEWIVTRISPGTGTIPLYTIEEIK